MNDETRNIMSGGEPDWSDRHASTRHIMQYFAFGHLPPGPLRSTSARFSELAIDLVSHLPDGPELSAGMRKLLEAKDCCVRAALEVPFGIPR